ncbi:MAG: hypothetical protein Q8K79_09955 [Solirubrobacteraceae bacterium]|nr:hypothetical protein [Solirubrobacteraceae bacterium]
MSGGRPWSVGCARVLEKLAETVADMGLRVLGIVLAGSSTTVHGAPAES